MLRSLKNRCLTFWSSIIKRSPFPLKVKHGLPVGGGSALSFGIEVGQFINMLPLPQHLVKEVDQQLLVELRAKQFLEAEVCEGIDVFIFGEHVALYET